MNELVLFAGAGGGMLGTMLAGVRTVGAVEIDPFCRDIIFARQLDDMLPVFPIWDDVRTFDGREWRGCVDLISSGPPCQRFSRAARGRSSAFDGFPDTIRIIEEVGPSFVLVENVAYGPIRKAAEKLHDLDFRIYIAKISAGSLGADHLRERFWLLAHTNDKSKLHCKIDAKVALLPTIYEDFSHSERGGGGTENGPTGRVDRLRAVGNMQYPKMAFTAWTMLQKEAINFVCS